MKQWVWPSALPSGLLLTPHSKATMPGTLSLRAPNRLIRSSTCVAPAPALKPNKTTCLSFIVDMLPPSSKSRRREWRTAQDDIGRLLGDHDRRRIGVARGHERHHGSVDHPQAREPANPKVGRHDRVGSPPHGAGSSRVVIGLARLEGVSRQSV